MSSLLNQIKPNIDSKSNKKRVGRGGGSGTGKTCGRGHKGQKSRTCLLYTSPSPRDVEESRMAGWA